MNGEIIQIMPAESLSLLAAVYQWGLSVIRIIQGIESPGLTAVIKFVTFLGTEVFIIPLLLLIFWCVDERRGFRLGILIILSAWVNASVKSLLKQPRPYSLDPSVGRAFEPSYGMPSGHAQMSLSFWVPIASWAGRKRLLVRAAVVFFILAIGFTRLYLGVHFPTDLLGGWLLGGIILIVFYFLSPWVAVWFRIGGRRTQLICAAAATLILNGLNPADTSLPALLLGFGAGYNLMIHTFPFAARGPVRGKAPGFGVLAFRYVFGMAGAAAIYLGLRLIFPGEASLFSSFPHWGQGSPYYELGRFIRYGLVGFWVSAGAPWVFLRMGIAGPGLEGDPASSEGPKEKAGD
jgi:membrane-associated phospholipid phosphatase